MRKELEVLEAQANNKPKKSTFGEILKVLLFFQNLLFWTGYPRINR